LQQHRLFNANIEKESSNLRGRRQLKKGGNPAWKDWAESPKGNGGNPEGSPSLDDSVPSATSVASEQSEDSEDVRRKLPGKGVEKSGNAWAQKGEKGPTSVDDSVTSGTSATSAASIESDDERRKLPGNGNGWGRGGNPDGSSPDDVTATSATSAASDDSEESEESEASVSVSSLDEGRRKLPGKAGLNRGNGSSGDVTVTSATSAASEDSGISATSAASDDSESVASVDSSAE